MKLLVNGRTQNGSDRPATLKAMAKGRDRDSCDFSPLYYRHTFPFQCEDVISSLVSGLFLFARPAAVRRRIACRIVDPIQRVFRRWTPAHIFEESLKGIPPLRTDRNPARSIVAIGRFFGVVAALKHASPNLILTALVHSVLGIASPGRFSLKTAAALAMSAAQESSSNDNRIPTSAAAQPADSPKCHFYRLERRKFSKLPVDEVLKRHRGIIDQQEQRRQQNSTGRKLTWAT